jgi:hypothetical protein
MEMAVKKMEKEKIRAGLIPVLRLMLLEAVPAVHWPTLGRLERYLGLGSTIGALNIMHFAGFAAVAASVVSVHYYTYLSQKIPKDS